MKKLCRLLIPLILLLDSQAGALGTGCDVVLNPIDGLIRGEKIYGTKTKAFRIDDQTARDANLDAYSQIFEKECLTAMGRVRVKEALREGNVDVSYAQDRMERIKYLAENYDAEEIVQLRAQLESLNKKNQFFLDYFKDFASLKDSLSMDIFWAAVTYATILGPIAYDNIALGNTGLHKMAHALFALAGFSGYGWWNKNEVVDPRRSDFDPFRGYLIAARNAHRVFGKVPDDKKSVFQELHDVTRTLYQGTPMSPMTKDWIKLNGFLDPELRDLAHEEPDPNHTKYKTLDESLADLVRRITGRGLVDQPVRTSDLAGLNRALRMQRRKWTFPKPNGGRGWLPQLYTMSDRVHIQQFWMRNVQSHLVEEKDALAKIFSALAELDFNLAAAKVYRENKNKAGGMIFGTLDPEGDTFMEAEELHNQVYAMTDPNSVANDYKMGRILKEVDGVKTEIDYPFTVVFGPVGMGARSYMQTALQAQIGTQVGLPIFAKSYRGSPAIFTTAIDMRNFVRGKSTYQLDAERITEILNMPEKYRHSFTYIMNPFVGEDEIAAAALRAIIIKHATESKVVGMLASQSPVLFGFLRKKSELPNLTQLSMDNFVARTFNSERDLKPVQPKEFYRRLVDGGLDQEIIDEAADLRNEARLDTFMSWWKNKGFKLNPNGNDEGH